MADINTIIPNPLTDLVYNGTKVTREWYSFFESYIRLVNNSIDGLTSLDTNGYVIRIAENEYTTRSIVAGMGITITNGDGVLGSTTISVNTSAIGEALTKVDDTNVTLTLNGNPASALLDATELVLGWSGELSLTRGGTAAALVADNGGIVYSTSTALALLASTATAGRVILSGSSSAPSWSTSTFSSTYTASNLLYSNGANNVTGLATGNSGVLITSAGGVPSISTTIPQATQLNITSVGTVTQGLWNSSVITPTYGGLGTNNAAASDGQIPIKNGTIFTAASLTAGTGITITNGAGSVTIQAVSSDMGTYSYAGGL